MTDYITWDFCGSMGFVFIYFLTQAFKLLRGAMMIKGALAQTNYFEALKKTKLATLCTSYEQTLVLKIDDKKKTNIPASEIFSPINVFKHIKLNIRLMDTAAGTLVGLGLLGTFLGLTFGISGFASTSTENIQLSIQSLLSGMSTAFVTSLLGMSLSLIFTTLFEKPWKHKLIKSLIDLSEKLDSEYYINDMALIEHQQQALFKSLITSIESHLTYTDQQGNRILIANAIREIRHENEEQSRALKSFSTDLSESLNNMMNEDLSPLLEKINDTTNSVVEHIDKMAAKVESPAADMIENVVRELKKSMMDVMVEFKSNITQNTTTELEGLASTLANTAQSMLNFPKQMEQISDTMNSSIAEIKRAVEDISSTSATSNSHAMQQMQEQITFATTSISNAITEVKEVMSSITHSSEQSNAQIMERMTATQEQLGQFLNSTMSGVTASVEDSMKHIAEHVSTHQSKIIMLQESTMEETKKLLELFNNGIERLDRVNTAVSGTMDLFQQAQGQITGSTAQLQTITSDMRSASESFAKGQADYMGSVIDIQRESQSGIDSIARLVKESGEMSDEYAHKFEVIRLGLSEIFRQLQEGLNEYSKTVQTSTQNYLDQYSNNLTQTADALSNTIQQQNDLVEELVEALNNKKN